MGIGTLKNLNDVRTRVLGYRRETVARLSGIAPERLAEIESDKAVPTVFELEQLSRIYGIDYEILLNRPIRLGPGDVTHITKRDSVEESPVNDADRKLLELAENATPRPYRLADYDGYYQIETIGTPSLCILDTDVGTHVERNVSFLVAAANAVPRLIAEKEALLRRIKNLRDLRRVIYCDMDCFANGDPHYPDCAITQADAIIAADNAAAKEEHDG